MVCALALPVGAQNSTGNLFGTVTDLGGNPLQGARVSLTGLGADRTQSTNEGGQFRFLGLDPGNYSLQVELADFGSVVRPNVVVSLGRNTNLELELNPAIQDVLTVTSETPLLDSREIRSGTQVSQTELEKIPSARDPWALLNQTPGVLVDRVNVGGNESGQQSVFRAQGVDDDQNDFMVDGFTITDMRATGASPTYYDFDQFAEMQFTTGGTDVTKSTAGVAVNLVTKRGSNEFRGSARFYNTKAGGYFGGALEQSQPNVDVDDLGDGQTGYAGARIREIEDMGFEAGGAAIRDRLWLWGAWGQNDIQQNAASGTADDTILENQSLKVNAQFRSANSAVASWNNGDKQKFGRGASPTRPDITTWNQRGPTAIYRFEDTHVFSSNLFATGSYSIGDAGFQLAAKGGTGPNAPEAWRDNTGVWHDNFQSGQASNPNDEFKVDGSYFFTTGDISHELKVGGRHRTFESYSAFSWPGRNIFTFNTGSTQLVGAQRGVSTPAELTYLSLWVQDTISFGSLTFNLGLRYDEQSGVNSAFQVPANPFVPDVLPALDFQGSDEDFTWETVAPRLGATWALGAERDTLVRASFAQFADQLGTGQVTRTNPAGVAYAYFVGPDPNQPYTGDGSDLVFAFPNGFDPSNPGALVDPDRTDPNLDAPITSELIVGIEHALMPEFVIGATVTARQVDDILELRTLVNDGNGIRTANVNDYQLDVANPELANGFLIGSLGGPNAGGGPFDYSVPVYSLRPGVALTGGQYLTNGTREREYLGYSVNFAKRLANRWMMRGYVNYGESEWKVDDEFLFHNDPNAAAGGGDRDGDLYLTLSAGSGKGQRFLQSSWSANLTGLYQIAPNRPWGFNLSGAVQAREGYPTPYFYNGLSTSDGVSRGINVVDDFSDFRLDDLVTLDLRIEKEFALSAAVNFTFGLDVFNVTNEGTELSRQRDVSSSSLYFLNDNVSPRIYRLGVRLGWK